jgi:ABC-2 type transport system permease protein
VSTPAVAPVESAANEQASPDLGGLGRPIKGPSALGSDPRRLWHLTWALAKTEFKLTFFGSALGYLWQLMRPLLLFGVIYMVFTVAHIGTKGPFYPAALLLGIVLFTFFSESSGGAVACLVNRENLVRKIEFPRLAVPLATVLTALFNVVLNLVPVLVFLLAAGGSVRLSWLELPLLVAMLAAFTAGLGMILSVGYVRYRDVKPIWDVVLQMTFYASGIFFAIAAVAGVKESGIPDTTVFGVRVNIGHVLMCNPFAALLEQARHAFIDPRYPSAAAALGGGALILVPIGIALATIVFGYLFFDREAPRVAEQL